MARKYTIEVLRGDIWRVHNGTNDKSYAEFLKVRIEATGASARIIVKG